MRNEQFVHQSDCSLHNEPAYPIENCDCDVLYQLLDEIHLRLSVGSNSLYDDTFLAKEIERCLSGDIRRRKEAQQILKAELRKAEK